MIRTLIIFLICLAATHCLGEETVIDSLDELRFRQPASKGRASVVEGRDGKAIEFTFEKDCQNVFFIGTMRGQPEWDQAAGFSFWVQGDGSSDVGALQFIYDDDYAVRYEYAFSLQEKEWHKVTVAWSDLTPVLPGPNSNPLHVKGGNKPSKLSSLWVGKWWHWRDYPAHSFALDDLRLVAEIDRPEVPESPGLVRVQAKLERGEPITIVTMGDSLTDTRHWANREIDWGALLKQKLEATYKSKVTIINPAIGGTQLRQGVIQIPRWLVQAPKPDLVTVCYGGNDWEAGMRGPQFRESCEMAVDRIRQTTQGKADVLILSTVPAVERWTTAGELAEGCREASQDRRTGLADLEKAFLRAGEKQPEKLFASDKVHLGAAGHKLVADTVFAAIEDKD